MTFRNGVFFLFLFVITTCSHAQTIDSTLYSESAFTLHTASVELFGTLCIPTNVKHYPVALIIAGSGPTDRDGNSPGGLSSDAYKILAHRLAANGIATLRYDKRGAGEGISAMKSEADLRFDDYISDARSWIDTLHASHDFSKVFVIGHSEGSLVGMVAASNADGYISIAGTGNPIGVVLKKQMAAKLSGPKLDTVYSIIDSLAAGLMVKHVPMALYTLFRKSVQPYMISWMKYHPVEEIKKLKVPILILQGTNDIQVDTTEARLLAMADPNAKLVLIPNMNHVFRIVGSSNRSDNLKTYSQPNLPISDELVNEITSFMK